MKAGGGGGSRKNPSPAKAVHKIIRDAFSLEVKA